MDIAATKLELMQHLMSISDPKTLKRVAVFFKKEVPKAVEEDDDLTQEELAELNDRVAKRKRGETTPHTEKASAKLLRDLVKR